jgi:phosphofructokinase-like protein
MRIGVLTGGGDCPGLNAVIRAIVRQGVIVHGFEFIGFRDGWAGVLRDEGHPLDIENTRGILHRGGTILGTSRTNPYEHGDGTKAVSATLDRHGVDALIPIGGDDTLGVAKRLTADGVPCVGVPKTIDNDLDGTDYTFGFWTAVQIATEAVDRLHTTAESHNRVIVVEVMGRHAGWIALHAGVAGGADVILIPEEPFDVEHVCDVLRKRHETGKTFSIVVVAEGAIPKGGAMTTASGEVDSFGHVRLGGIGLWLQEEIQSRTGYDTRETILGHVQRGGTPLAYDRMLATRFGLAAVDTLARGQFGSMVALRGTRIEVVPLEEALAAPKLVTPDVYEGFGVFFEHGEATPAR